MLAHMTKYCNLDK